jgi:hypothetical protein
MSATPTKSAAAAAASIVKAKANLTNAIDKKRGIESVSTTTTKFKGGRKGLKKELESMLQTYNASRCRYLGVLHLMQHHKEEETRDKKKLDLIKELLKQSTEQRAKNKGTRKVTGRNMFFSQNLPKRTEGMTRTDIMKAVHAQWTVLSPDQQLVWTEKAEAENQIRASQLPQQQQDSDAASDAAASDAAEMQEEDSDDDDDDSDEDEEVGILRDD